MMVGVRTPATVRTAVRDARRMPVARALRRTVTVLAVAVVALLAGAGAAQAHSTLVSTDPADGSTVGIVPAQVTLTFSEPVEPLGTQVVVLAPDGRTVSSGDAVLAGTSVSEALVSGLPAGAYRVEWRITSSDGHPVSGTFGFTATAGTATAGTATAGPAQPAVTAATAGPTPATFLPVPGDQVSLMAVAPDADTDTGVSAGTLTGLAAVVVVLAVIGGAWLRRRRVRADGA
jgi:methionine-rich copper-binding protein CopC